MIQVKLKRCVHIGAHSASHSDEQTKATFCQLGRWMWLLFQVAIYTISCSTLAAAELVISDESLLNGENVSICSSYLEDPSNSLILADVVNSSSFRKVDQSSLNFGYSDSAYWLRLKLINKASIDRELVLSLDHPLIDSVDLYVSDHSNYLASRSGDAIPFHDREILYRNISFSLTLKAGAEETIFFRVRTTSSYTFGLYLWSKQAFQRYIYKDFGFNCLVYGLMLGLISYNLIIYYSTRSRRYLFYTGWLLCHSLNSFAWSGLGKELLWGSSDWLSQRTWPISNLLSNAAIIMFQLHFFRLKETFPRIAKLYFLLAITITAMAVSATCTPVSFNHRITLMTSLIVAPLVFVISFMLNPSKNKQVRYFLAAFSLFICVILFSVISILFNISFPYFNLIYATQVASCIEAILLSMALADQINSASLALVQSANKEQHLAIQLRKIVYPHQVGMISGGAILEDTMPTIPGEACVLSLDIVGSSKIKHIRAKDFLRIFFKRCYEEMMLNYNEKTLMASGYRIKEMGDGFLCSVGYPFLASTDNPAECAIRIAERFVEILDTEAAFLHTPKPITCGIGIAIGSLCGFYPESGTKEYDLYGPALVLATRYEGLRKSLFEAENGRHIIIIQELVYLSLPPEVRENYREINIKEMNFVVRDDPAAQFVYYRTIRSRHDKNAIGNQSDLKAV